MRPQADVIAALLNYVQQQKYTQYAWISNLSKHTIKVEQIDRMVKISGTLSHLPAAADMS